MVRNVPLVVAPLSQVLSGSCQKLVFTAHADRVVGEFVGLVPRDPTPRHPGAALRGERSGYDFRPQIVGVFTDLSGPAPPGLTFSATIDTRYSSSPTPLKMAAMVARGGADARRADRAARPGHFRRHPAPPLPAAPLVVAERLWTAWSPLVLVWWHFVGANTADDGYILTMARVSEHAGYMANYYRWLGTPEAPFGWYYDLLALWAHVTTASIWMRLPTLLMALACWWVISREVIPRLGHCRQDLPRGGMDGGGHVPGGVAAAGQRSAAGADHRRRHPADLVFGRTRGGHQSAAAGGGRGASSGR